MDSLESQLSELQQSNRDLQSDMDAVAQREGDHLSLQQKMSDKNAWLQTENSTLGNRLSGVTAEFEVASEKVAMLEEQVDRLVSCLGNWLSGVMAKFEVVSDKAGEGWFHIFATYTSVGKLCSRRKI